MILNIKQINFVDDRRVMKMINQIYITNLPYYQIITIFAYFNTFT